MKIKITILIVLLTLTSCKAGWKANYERFQSEFLPAVFESFPELNILKSSEIAADFTGVYEYIGYRSLSILYEYTDEESFAKALSDIEKRTIVIYDSFDTCLVSVYKMEDTIYNCENHYYPVYNDYDMPYVLTADPNRNQRISDTVQYHVFDCREGWFIKDDSLKHVVGNRTGYLRKKTYQHGFSNGAIVDRKKLKIVYWVFVW